MMVIIIVNFKASFVGVYWLPHLELLTVWRPDHWGVQDSGSYFKCPNAASNSSLSLKTRAVLFRRIISPALVL